MEITCNGDGNLDRFGLYGNGGSPYLVHGGGSGDEVPTLWVPTKSPLM